MPKLTRSLRRCVGAGVALEAAITSVREIIRYDATSEAADQAEMAALRLKHNLYNEAEHIRFTIWLALPPAVRAEALIARRDANAFLLELAAKEASVSDEQQEVYAAGLIWNECEGLLSEAIIWDLESAEAYGISLDDVSLDDDDDL